MSGTAPDLPLPPPHPGSQTHTPVTVNAGGAAATIDAAGSFLSRLSGFNEKQAQTVAVLVLTLVVCTLLGWQLYSGRQIQAETLAIVIRSMESEAEKNRAANAVEFERNRATFTQESKANRDALADTTKLSIASHQKLAQELGRIEQVVSGLVVAINELKKKLPPEEVNVYTVPRPRLTGPREGGGAGYSP